MYQFELDAAEEEARTLLRYAYLTDDVLQFASWKIQALLEIIDNLRVDNQEQRG
jgi:hypothetical protein